jgi:hypothetical protein
MIWIMVSRKEEGGGDDLDHGRKGVCGREELDHPGRKGVCGREESGSSLVAKVFAAGMIWIIPGG